MVKQYKAEKGVTDKEKRDIEKALDDIAKTKKGKPWIQKIRKSDDVYLIDVKDGEGSQSTKMGTAPASGGVITIRRGDMNLGVGTDKGVVKFDLVRILAHEIGHLMTNDKDDGPNDMNNSKRNENPIMRDLGKPERTVYYPPFRKLPFFGWIPYL